MTPESRLIARAAKGENIQADAQALEARKKAAKAARSRRPVRRVAGPSRSESKRIEEAKAERHRARVYASVDRRSGGVCEMGSGVTLCMNDAAEHDHFWGRGKAEETPENAWHLCKFHHDNKTAWDPSRLAWLERFRLHCWRHDFREELAKVDRAIALERGQHPEARSSAPEAAK